MPLSSLDTVGGLSSITSALNPSTLPNLGGSSASSAAPASNSGPSWLTGELAQITVILLGVVLIIGGIFSIQKVQAVTGAAARAAVAA